MFHYHFIRPVFWLASFLAFNLHASTTCEDSCRTWKASCDKDPTKSIVYCRGGLNACIDNCDHPYPDSPYEFVSIDAFPWQIRLNETSRITIKDPASYTFRIVKGEISYRDRKLGKVSWQVPLTDLGTINPSTGEYRAPSSAPGVTKFISPVDTLLEVHVAAEAVWGSYDTRIEVNYGHDDPSVLGGCPVLKPQVGICQEGYLPVGNYVAGPLSSTQDFQAPAFGIPRIELDRNEVNQGLSDVQRTGKVSLYACVTTPAYSANGEKTWQTVVKSDYEYDNAARIAHLRAFGPKWTDNVEQGEYEDIRDWYLPEGAPIGFYLQCP